MPVPTRTVPALVLSLGDTAAHDPARAGAKAAALAAMTAAGLPVPDGFVLTTDAFALAAADKLPAIAEVLARLETDDLAALEGGCRLARDVLMADGLPKSVAAAAGEAYAALGRGPVSVRSSATAEDLPGMSFAGQYDSVLNVLDEAALHRAVLQVWASLFSARAVAYRRRHGLADTDVQMAVVVQRLVPAEAAGVLFTCDPVSGATDRCVVNAAYGLGEGVVAGAAPADRLTLDAATGAVLAAELAAKDSAVQPDPAGGIRREPVAGARRTAPALSDGELRSLFDLAGTVVGLFAGPQDIEFAVAGGTVYLLQARPVTAIAPPPPVFPVTWENPADETKLWLLSRFRPGPLYRLEEDALAIFNHHGRICFEETGAPMTRNYPALIVNGYHYQRPVEDEHQTFVNRLRALQEQAMAAKARGTSYYDEIILPEVERHLEDLRRTRPRRATLPALVAHLDRALAVYGRVMGDLHWRMAAATVSRTARDASSMGDWPGTFHELTGEPEMNGVVFLQAVPNKTTRLIHRLRVLARIVQSDPDLTAIFASRQYERLASPPVRTSPAGRRFRRGFRSLLRVYGRRNGRGFGSSTGFDAPTWSMKPEQPLDLIGSYAQQNLDRLDALEAAARRERLAAIRRMRRRLAGQPDHLARFEQAYAQAVEDIVRMEDHNHLMEQSTFGALREAIARLGGYLVRRRLLDHEDEVLHLTTAELRALAAGDGPADLRALVRERAAERAQREAMQPPPTLGSGTPSGPRPGAMYDLPPGVGRDGALLRGVAASRGRFTGRARVVRPGAEPPALTQGDILVAHNAGPDWTPVFPVLGALVLNEGAIFQHAALVAREYKIPAVILTRDATTTVTDGQTITVDGDAGLVHLTP